MERIEQIIKVHNSNLPQWKKKLFFWLVKLESKTYQKICRKEDLIHVQIILK